MRVPSSLCHCRRFFGAYENYKSFAVLYTPTMRGFFVFRTLQPNTQPAAVENADIMQPAEGETAKLLRTTAEADINTTSTATVGNHFCEYLEIFHVMSV